MGRQPTYYELLGVDPGCTEKEVKLAYWRTAKGAHPDFGGSKALFHLVSEAYTVLGDPVRRARYDRELTDKVMVGGEDGVEGAGEGNPTRRINSWWVIAACVVFWCINPWACATAVTGMLALLLWGDRLRVGAKWLLGGGCGVLVYLGAEYGDIRVVIDSAVVLSISVILVAYLTGEKGFLRRWGSKLHLSGRENVRS